MTAFSVLPMRIRIIMDAVNVITTGMVLTAVNGWDRVTICVLTAVTDHQLPIASDVSTTLIGTLLAHEYARKATEVKDAPYI